MAARRWYNPPGTATGPLTSRQRGLSPIRTKSRANETPATADLLKNGAAEFGLSLSQAHLRQFSRYYRALVEWNARVNLTSVTQWEEVQTTHFLDSLTVCLGMLLILWCYGRK